MRKNFQLPGRSIHPSTGYPATRTSGKFFVHGRGDSAVEGNAKARDADTPWYVPGLKRRNVVRNMNDFEITYDDVNITYLGLKLTYTEPAL